MEYPVQETRPVQSVTTPEDAAVQDALRRRGSIPRHIAVIMDGNGRWANERGQTRVAGHNQGTVSVRDVTEACAELGVDFLTLYTFSTENWQRPMLEVAALMELLVYTLRAERDTLLKNDIRLVSIGDLSKLPTQCRAELQETIEATAGNTRMTLCLAISYSGRWDMLQAARQIAHRVREGRLDPEEVTEETIEKHLVTAGMPDPDLLIRSGGEYRVSNFLLWQIAYEAIRNYQDRDRRFGRVH